MSNEIFKRFSDDPEFIERSIAEEPPLCMVVRKNLNARTRGILCIGIIQL